MDKNTYLYLPLIPQTYSVPPKELPESGTLASLVLYSGLVLAATGLVITAVGLGDKGFRSRELRLLGPGIMLSGVGLTMLRCYNKFALSINR